MKEVKQLLEVTVDELNLELQTVVFVDDLRIFCEKYKLPEELIEEKFLFNDNLPERINRTIFTKQPLSKEFLVKHMGKYKKDWLSVNPFCSQDLIDEITMIEKLTENDSM
jgi:hypothetical protein